MKVKLSEQSSISACQLTVSDSLSCQSLSSLNPPHKHKLTFYTWTHTQVIPVYTAGRQLNPRQFYRDLLLFLLPLKTLSLFLTNKLTQSHSLSSKPSTLTPPIPREKGREREVDYCMSKCVSFSIRQSSFFAFVFLSMCMKLLNLVSLWHFISLL